MSAVFAVTVLRVPLFVWDVNILRECEGGGNAGVGNGMCGCCEFGVVVYRWYTWFR